MRIPITIKIPVNDAGEVSVSSLAQIAVRDISSGIEKIGIRMLNHKPPAPRPMLERPSAQSQLHWQTMRTRFPVLSQPKPQAAPAVAIPRVRYSVKTIHITLTWPTLPSVTELLRMFGRLPQRAWIGIGVVAIAMAAVIVGIQLSGAHHSGSPKAPAISQLPSLPRGTPSYATILPAGKTIQSLGGWVRISPPDKDPVYTYVDKIAGVQIDVSEQPLPAAFQRDTANKIAQLATSYNATDKFQAGNNVEVYVGSGSAEGEQSVILVKSGLLILIKSAGPLTNNQWVGYISSLH